MPSSYIDSVPPIVKLLVDISPGAVIDVGPGWGKYGLACREYLLSLQDLWAVEVTPGRLPIQDAIYDRVIEEDVRRLCEPGSAWPWERFDVVLFIDVIEHLSLQDGHMVLRHVQSHGCKVLVSTPQVFIEQHDPSNPFEDHISLWRWEDFARHGIEADASTSDSIIYLLAAR